MGREQTTEMATCDVVACSAVKSVMGIDWRLKVRQMSCALNDGQKRKTERMKRRREERKKERKKDRQTEKWKQERQKEWKRKNEIKWKRKNV